MSKTALPLFLVTLLVCFCGFSCTNSSDIPLNIQVIYGTDSCNDNKLHTYEIFFPVADKKCAGLPLVIILDPHGEGSVAMEQFTLGAEEYNYALVASNLIRNNSPDYSPLLMSLISDVKKKYPVNEDIYLAGFSGGARMALNFAQHYPIDGLIVSGALANNEQIKAIGAPVMSIVGMSDFNFIEVAQYIFKPSAAPSNLRIEFTNSIHSWPEPELLRSAMAYVLSSDEKPLDCLFKKKTLEKFCLAEKNRIQNLYKKNESLRAGLIARNMAKDAGFLQYEDFISLRNRLEYSSAFISEISQLKESIRFELTVRNEYYTALKEEKSAWWKPEIERLHELMHNEEDIFKKMAYNRIKGYLGILCYSYCNQSSTLKNMEDLKRLVAIYRLLEPENPDMFYFMAQVLFEEGHEKQTISTLQKALEAGFNDPIRMKNEFPQRILKALK